MELELVGVGVEERHTVSQPEHIGGVHLLVPRAFQGAVQSDRFAQRGDDDVGAQLELQIFE